MPFKIDLIKYHITDKDEAAIAEARTILHKLSIDNKTFNNHMKECFSKYNDKYTSLEKEELLIRMVISITKELNNYDIKYDDNYYYSYLRKQIYKTLPLILENQKEVSINSNFLYEPNNVYSLYLLNNYYSYINKYFTNKALDNLTNDDYLMLLVQSLIRNLKSSLLMFSLADDVHGVGVLRGAIEIFSRVAALDNDEFFNEFKYFVTLNAKLQYYKRNNIEFDKYDEALKNIMLDNHLTTNSIENYLLCGWARNKKGKRILHISDLIKEMIPELLPLYKSASEFVHEDYILVAYDYLDIRQSFGWLLNRLVVELYDILEDKISYIAKKDKEINNYLKSNLKDYTPDGNKLV